MKQPGSGSSIVKAMCRRCVDAMCQRQPQRLARLRTSPGPTVSTAELSCVVVTIPSPMQAPEALREPFTDTDWLYELKFDGYRCLTGIERAPAMRPQTRLQMAADAMKRVRLQAKSGTDCTTWFPEIAEAVAMLPGGPHVIDGEVCVLRSDGTSDFNMLQARGRMRKPYPGGPQVTLMAFDILVHDGKKVMDRPLVERKALLQQLLQGMPPVWVLFVGDLPADAAVFKAMVDAGLQIEGVMAKRRECTYQPGVRSLDWAKIKRPGWQGRN
jgi:bifunctional non-homologous end joining protein LigD